MLTRGEFLRVSTLLGGGVLLASCTPRPTDYTDRETDTLRRLLILYTNDEHGWIEPSDENGGAPGLAYLWNNVEDFTPGGANLALSGGDLWTGPAISTYFQGESTIDVMNSLGYAAAAIGNHDFDDGLEVLRQRAQQANFPLLSANIRRKEDGAIPDFAQPYTILEVNGIRLGLIGLTTTETPIDTQPSHVAEFDFLPYKKALQEVAPQVKAAGANLIAVLGHICTAEMRRLAPLAAELGISILFGGHCHEETVETVEGVTIVQSGSFLHNYIRIALLFDSAAGKIVEISPSLQPNPKGRKDQEMEDQVKGWHDRAEPCLWETIGYAGKKIDWDSPAMAVLITQPWLEAYPSAQAALASPRYVQSLPAGEISRGSLLSMLPTDNELVEISLSGAQIVETIQARKPLLGGVYEVEGEFQLQDGTPLDPSAIYCLLIPNALYEGANYYSVQEYAPNGKSTGLDWRSPIVDWVIKQQTSKGNPLEQLLPE